MTVPADRAYLSPDEFAARHGLSVVTVRRYLRAGMLPFVQPAGRRGRVLIPADALSASMLKAAAAAVAGTSPTSPAGAADVGRATPTPRRGPRPMWERDAGPSRGDRP